jgi:hypothetical protein
MTDRDEHETPLRGHDLHHEEGRGDALAGDERSEDELRGESALGELDELTRAEILEELSLDEVATLTGLPRPVDPSPDEEREFRELAWQNVKLDIEARDEWGGVTPDADPDEDPGTEEEQRAGSAHDRG